MGTDRVKTGKDLIADIDACKLAPGECGLWWLGQHGFAVKLGRCVCYVDAFLTDLPDRQVRPPLRPQELTNAALVLGSHDHADHIDRDAWPAIATASPAAVFVVPELLADTVAQELDLARDRVLGVDDGLTVRCQGVSVTGVPAAHEFLERDEATGLNRYVGFVIEGNGFRLYHAGDTCLYEGMQDRLRRRPLDLALLPINGRDAKRLAAGSIGNMTYQEAADLAAAISPGLTIPTHYEMFAMNSEDPQLFLDYVRVKYPRLRTALPAFCERQIIERRQ
jgi:L-ascorbate 6-phosphate lactonase